MSADGAWSALHRLGSLSDSCCPLWLPPGRRSPPPLPGLPCGKDVCAPVPDVGGRVGVGVVGVSAAGAGERSCRSALRVFRPALVAGNRGIAWVHAHGVGAGFGAAPDDARVELSEVGPPQLPVEPSFGPAARGARGAGAGRRHVGELEVLPGDEARSAHDGHRGVPLEAVVLGVIGRSVRRITTRRVSSQEDAIVCFHNTLFP